MIDTLFIVALVLIWVCIFHNLTLQAAASVTLYRRTRRPEATRPVELEGVSVLVPARNEEAVIASSLQRYLELDYPSELLQVILIDDGSTDATGIIADRVAAQDDRLTVIHVPPEESGRGKAAALNRALPACRHPLLAVYDADDTPRPDALRLLVAELGDGRHVAAVGRIVKVNRTATLLNRFSWLDFATFQWTFQAGRAGLFDTVLIPGTNFVIRVDALRDLGGWDTRALTEDLELSVRIYCAGSRVALVPEAASEEQDPETVAVWLRQRTRWLLGAYYVLSHRTGAMLRSRQPRACMLVWEMVELYAFFLFALVVSQLVFLAGLLGIYDLGVGGPLRLLWALALVLFLVPLQTAAAWEHEDSWRTPLIGLAMYLLYAPLWLVVFARALKLGITGRGKGGMAWAKTPHARV